jgi:hypothetical protein
MMTFFHISIIWIGPEKSVETLRPIFNLAEDWQSLGTSNYIIYTNENAYIWQGRIMAIISAEDYFFLFEISNIKTSGGFLPKALWDWIKKDRKSPVLLPPVR